MFNFFQRKHKYLNCPHLKHSLHFFHDEIRSCCSNAKGPVFYKEFDKIDWNYIYNERKKYLKNINKTYKNGIPPECEGCFEINHCLEDKEIKDIENRVDRIYFQNNMTCNAKCIYCTFKDESKGQEYQGLPLIKQLIEKKILSKNACVYMSGGEITISPEFENLLTTLTEYLDNKVEILTSCIKYCESIKQAFIKDKLRMVVSLDSASRETYLKIKMVDCFDKVINNLKAYVEASDYAKDNITLKYIIVDNVNDNIEEITKFINLVKNLGIKNIRMDINYEEYRYTGDKKVPEYYFDLYEKFNKTAQDLGLCIQKCEQVEAILNKK